MKRLSDLKIGEVIKYYKINSKGELIEFSSEVLEKFKSYVVTANGHRIDLI